MSRILLVLLLLTSALSGAETQLSEKSASVEPERLDSQPNASNLDVGADSGINSTAAAKTTAKVWVIDIQGAVGPVTSDLITRSLKEAAKADAELFLIRLDTPGGLDKSMRTIIQAILSSTVPVATFVSPKGARAASAGTYILYSSHISAMAPATNLGAATPVQISAPSLPKPAQPPKEETKDKSASESDGLTTMERKQINDAVAYIRSLAELRGRNADWAELAVRSAASIAAEEALQENVIDLVAEDTADLISQLNGSSVFISGRTSKLELESYELHTVIPDWRSEFLAVITDPSVAYILMLIGIYGLILEFYNPGMGLPGILGGICLITALYALQLLPISYAGLGLILLGVALMIAEAFAPSFGVLGIGGAVAFVFGSIMLMDTDLPAFQIALPVIAALAVSSVLIFSIFLHLALRARKQAVVSGVSVLIGADAEVLEDFDEIGRVVAQGEIWRAKSISPVKKGDQVKITAVNGLMLHVET